MFEKTQVIFLNKEGWIYSIYQRSEEILCKRWEGEISICGGRTDGRADGGGSSATGDNHARHAVSRGSIDGAAPRRRSSHTLDGYDKTR